MFNIEYIKNINDVCTLENSQSKIIFFHYDSHSMREDMLPVLTSLVTRVRDLSPCINSKLENLPTT